MNQEHDSKMKLDIEGLGIILYSPFAAKEIAEGENYFSAITQHPNKFKNIFKAAL